MTDDRDDDLTHDLGSAARQLPIPIVPPEVSRALRATFHASLPVVPAELIADSRAEAGPVGVRGGAATAWTMSYRAGPCDVVLDLVPQRRAIHVGGQLLCDDATPEAPIRVFLTEELVASATTDEFGQFDIGDLRPELYVVVAATSDHVIEILVDLRDATT